MISETLTVLERGLKIMKSNSRMVLVAILVFVFPLIFVWVTQNFFATAYDNIDTAEKKRVAMLHDTIAAVLQTPGYQDELLSNLINYYGAENPDITKVRILKVTESGLLITHALREDLINSYDESTATFETLPGAVKSGPVIVPLQIDGVRVWQVFRQVQTDTVDYYVFSEHSFSMIDAVMAARRQESYYGLTAIFLFLIALAYWINRQTHWSVEHSKLQTQLRDRDLFSNMIAHEFRAPLTAIKGYASFLQESESIEATDKRYVSNIRTSAERLVALVNDFLEVARLQSGKMDLQMETIDVRKVVIAVAEDLKPTATEKGLSLTYKPGTKPLPVSTDKNRLTQVLINIVNNAIKYTNEGSVELSVQEERERVIIRVMDTGMGISAEDQKKLFAPFERVGNVEQTATTGTGLGMYITKKLIELLGGTIGVESIKGVGSHIVLSLPLE
ncbi:MAG: HAMP domain-containing histidine kinase [Candidatus Kaiserbacteria bacterium]|nr:HAMP domain-containing histidine kinase [Candidatus Kaiserbacteria bacterium]MCB9815965.1 HAMP domain-containing histidine kinase [Candidatus Nomurabacteria bacterium]